MSFSGKKYRRTTYENVEKLAATNGAEYLAQVVKFKAPTLCYTRMDENTFAFKIQADEKTFATSFKLGQEFEMERIDGHKMMVLYTMEGDNVLLKKVKMHNGKIVYFRNVFTGDASKMISTIRIEGTDIEATINYEVLK